MVKLNGPLLPPRSGRPATQAVILLHGYGADGSDPKAGEEWLAALRDLGTDADKPFLEAAPWLIVVFAQRKGGIAEDGQTQNYYVNESVGIACGMLLATLHAAGVATLTHTPSPMGFLRRVCGRPEWEKPVMIIVAGRPAPDAGRGPARTAATR